MSKTGQRTLAVLRNMIVSGELTPGERVAEVPIAERLGVSRMPVRVAFPALEQEGLLEKVGKRGYQVRRISADLIADAIGVRGTLEGMAARLVAERKMTPEVHAALSACLAEGDAIFEKGGLDDDVVEAYHDLNKRFHRIIVEAAGNYAITAALARNDALPFASVASIAVDRDHLDREFERLRFAHLQHHVIFDALSGGQSGRAEAAMREHANAALGYAELFGTPGAAPPNLRVIID